MSWDWLLAPYDRKTLTFMIAWLPAALVASQGHTVDIDAGGGRSHRADNLARKGVHLGLQGDTTKRAITLRLALRVDPDCELARWHMGQLRVADQWLTIDEAEQTLAQDPQRQEYRRLRDVALDDPERELALARWCHGCELHDAERLHLFRVIRHPSSSQSAKKEAIRKLRLTVYGGMLLTDEEIALYKRQVEQNRQAFEEWVPRIDKWVKAIQGGARKRQFALKQFRGLRDPAAIPTLEMLLSTRSEELALELVSLLSNMPQQEATVSLVRHAVDSPWSSVGDAAVQTLQRRPLHDYAPLLLQRLVSPIQSQFSLVIGRHGSVWHQHKFFREGPSENFAVMANAVAAPHVVGIASTPDLATRIDLLRETLTLTRLHVLQGAIAAGRIEQHVAQVNTAIDDINQRTYAVLERVTGEALPRSPLAWWEWWQEYNEVYCPAKPTHTYDFVSIDLYPIVTMTSCFPRGTQVRTEIGTVDIQKIKVGDRVLSQHPETGELAYKLVMHTTLRPPSPLLRISFGKTIITTTKGHPFWVNNVGWRMAKQIEPGQQLHTIDGAQTVDAVEAAAPAEAYNLVVAEFGTYFVSDAGVLVHDNTYRKPTNAVTPGLSR
jgi:hypothetical protein